MWSLVDTVDLLETSRRMESKSRLMVIWMCQHFCRPPCPAVTKAANYNLHLPYLCVCVHVMGFLIPIVSYCCLISRLPRSIWLPSSFRLTYVFFSYTIFLLLSSLFTPWLSSPRPTPNLSIIFFELKFNYELSSLTCLHLSCIYVASLTISIFFVDLVYQPCIRNIYDNC